MDELEILADAFGAETAILSHVEGLLSEDESARFDAETSTHKLEVGDWTEEQALAVLDVALTVDFPGRKDWRDPSADLCTKLWDVPHQSLVEPAAAGYADARSAVRIPLLALLASRRSEAGVKAFVSCVREHGWPDTIYDRVFWELQECGEFADIMFPDLLLLAGPYFVGVGTVLLAALQRDQLTQPLPGVAEDIGSRLDAIRQLAANAQKTRGSAWLFKEHYAAIRREAGFLLDLSGWLGEPSLSGSIEPFLEMQDAWLVTFAVTSLLRLGHDVAQENVERAAASPETRHILWNQLVDQGLLDRFPAEYGTLDAFAEADMVNWLKYPTELGKLPSSIEKMEVFDVGDDVLYVWRFKGSDGAWMASVSGPYPADAVGPVSGGYTFSRFEPWGDKSAEEHAMDVIETLKEWGDSR